MLDVAAAPLERIAFAPAPARLTLAGGATVDGTASVAVERSSIAIAFEADEPYTLPPARYGEPTGTLAARDGSWVAPRVAVGPGGRGFDAPSLRTGTGPQTPGTTRLILAGAAFDAADPGPPALRARALADAPNHHDRRLAIEIDAHADDAALERLAQAAGFVAGLDLEPLAVERCDASGVVRATEYRRGLRRVGRFPHTPFAGVDPAARARAFVAVARRLAAGDDGAVPLAMVIDQINASNHVAQINLSAQLLLLATQTASYACTHGATLDGGAASRAPEVRRASEEFRLGLTDADVERFEKLRVELLDAGFFHAPGYETGRPQRDIKFLRDIAHRIVFRLSGYRGPYYVSERFEIEEFA